MNCYAYYCACYHTSSSYNLSHYRRRQRAMRRKKILKRWSLFFSCCLLLMKKSTTIINNSAYAKFLFHIKFSKLNLLAQRKIGNFYLKHLFRCSLIFQPLNQNQNMWVLWTQIIFSQYYKPLSFESHQVSLVISNSNNRWILIWLLGRKGKISILDPRFT